MYKSPHDFVLFSYTLTFSVQGGTQRAMYVPFSLLAQLERTGISGVHLHWTAPLLF